MVVLCSECKYCERPALVETSNCTHQQSWNNEGTSEFGISKCSTMRRGTTNSTQKSPCGPSGLLFEPRIAKR